MFLCIPLPGNGHQWVCLTCKNTVRCRVLGPQLSKRPVARINSTPFFSYALSLPWCTSAGLSEGCFPPNQHRLPLC